MENMKQKKKQMHQESIRGKRSRLSKLNAHNLHSRQTFNKYYFVVIQHLTKSKESSSNKYNRVFLFV